MQNGLNTTSSTGSQTSTQNPQSTTADSGLTSNQSNLQSGPVNLFNSTSGVTLNPTTLPSVALTPSASTTSSQLLPPVKHHQVNAVLLGIVIALFLVALLTFWKTTMAAKTTTE